MNINSFPLRVGCCVFAAQPQLISDVVWFVTVTLTGFREHQRQILHFPKAYGEMIPPHLPRRGQPTGLTARRLAAQSRTETPGAPRQRRAAPLVWDQRERRPFVTGVHDSGSKQTQPVNASAGCGQQEKQKTVGKLMKD